VSAIELVANSGQLPAFEFAHAQAAPAFSRSDQSGVDQLEHGALTESVRDDFGTSPLLAEQPLEKVGRTDRTPVRESGKRRWAMQASKSSCKHASADGMAAP